MAICFYCDTDRGPFVREHFVPRQLGGGLLGAANVVTSCKRCDQAKGGMHPREWLMLCPTAGILRVRLKLEELGLADTRKPLHYRRPLPAPPPGPVASLREHAAAYMALPREPNTTG